jgi:hypothetical protein
MPSPLDTAIRTLLLPVKPGTGDEYGTRAEEILDELGVAEDKADWVELEAAAWQQSGDPTQEFKTFIQSLLFSPDQDPKTFIIEPAALGDEVTGNSDERQPSWPVPTTTLAGGSGRKTGMPVWRAAPPA